MPVQISAGEVFVNGQQVDGTRLNNHINGAIILKGAIKEQTQIESPILASDDKFLVIDTSADNLRQVNASSLVQSNLPVISSLVTSSNYIGQANQDISIIANDGVVVTGKAFTSVNGTTVLITSVAHGLVAGQIILVAASIGAYSGNYRITSVTTDTITYTISTAVTPGSGTCSYTKVGTVFVDDNLVILGNDYVNGNVVQSGTVTQTGTVNVTGTANFTGALQVNGTVGYVLTEVYEETIPYTLSLASQSNLWTSASFTKPVGEIWAFEFSMAHAGYRGYVYEFGIRYGSQPYGHGNYLFIERFHDGDGGGAYNINTFNGRFIIQPAISMTDTLKLDINQGNAFSIGAVTTNTSFPSSTLAPSKLRIYKYRTA